MDSSADDPWLVLMGWADAQVEAYFQGSDEIDLELILEAGLLQSPRRKLDDAMAAFVRDPPPGKYPHALQHSQTPIQEADID